MSRNEISNIEECRDKPALKRSRRKMIPVNERTHGEIVRRMIRQQRKLGRPVSMGEVVAMAVNGGDK